MILAHELAHIRRHDYFFNLLQVLVEAVLFYHPVVHWISQDARNEREFCCDDIAVQTCGNRVSYLKALAALETYRLRASPALAANGGTLWSRAYRLAYRIEPISQLPVRFGTLVLLAGLLAASLLIHSHDTPAPRVAIKPAVIRSLALPQIHTSAAGTAEFVAAQPASIHIKPTHLRLTLPREKIRLAQSLGITVPAQAIPTLTAPPTPQLAAIQAPAVPVITVLAPHPLPQPEYPYQALRDGLGGTVQAAFRVSRSGRATDIQTQMISGPPMLATAVREALENWQFNPVHVNGQTLTPQISLAFVFNPNSAIRPASACPTVTDSHLCHWYRISLQDTLPQASGGRVAGKGVPINLAVVGNRQGAVCRPQDACFFTASQPAPGHEQQIKNQLRLLSQGFAFNSP